MAGRLSSEEARAPCFDLDVVECKWRGKSLCIRWACTVFSGHYRCSNQSRTLKNCRGSDIEQVLSKGRCFYMAASWLKSHQHFLPWQAYSRGRVWDSSYCQRGGCGKSCGSKMLSCTDPCGKKASPAVGLVRKLSVCTGHTSATWFKACPVFTLAALFGEPGSEAALDCQEHCLRECKCFFTCLFPIS